MSSLAPELARRSTARDRVLAALLAAGAKGCTNVELCAPDCGGMRAVGRVDELRDTWHIETVHVRRGVYRYVLKGRREPVQADLWGAA